MDLIGMIGIRSVLWCLTSVKMMGVVYSQLTPDNTGTSQFCFTASMVVHMLNDNLNKFLFLHENNAGDGSCTFFFNL